MNAETGGRKDEWGKSSIRYGGDAGESDARTGREREKKRMDNRTCER